MELEGKRFDGGDDGEEDGDDLREEDLVGEGYDKAE